MINATLQQHIQQVLQQVTGLAVSSLQFSTVGGGSINDTYKILAGNRHNFFCKINSVTEFPSLFEREKRGLELLAAQQVIRIPQVIALTIAGDKQVLLLEWIEQGLQSQESWKLFGGQLASLHHIHSNQFGLMMDNYMGALPQYNKPGNNWCDFFIQQRLQPQVKLALDRHLLNTKHVQQFERLYPQLPGIFSPEPACLLHGDLWSGNYLCDKLSKPVLIDPAVYYGHRSVDLAMTTLFGGFDKQFYESYHYHYPLPVNYGDQWEVCNLYPLLIHLNLFGQSYLGDILRTIQRY